jgi:copper resistance protein B
MNGAPEPRLRLRALALGVAVSVASPLAIAQHAGHAHDSHDAQRDEAAATAPPADPHAGHHAADRAKRDAQEPRTPIPPVTPADRAAAFPDVAGHAVHDDAIHHYVRLHRLEIRDTDEGTALDWEGSAWIGTDLDRLWLRSEGERVDGTTESANLEVLYGRSVAPWWDVVVGVREDFGEACPERCRRSPSRTFAALGVQGLTPYKFELQATAYLGEGGRSAVNVEIEYDTLLTNRLVLQWLAEADWYGEDDPQRGIGSGLSSIEAGLRLRYEVTRRFAPYLGIVRERAYGTTADLRRAQFEDTDDTRVVAGVRVWF